jgi:polysaccharide export outer membrane protein
MRRFLCLAVFFSLLASSVFAQVALLRTGDVFEMRLSGMPAEYASEFTLQYTVGQDGTVNIPMIGEVKAVELTSTQLERTIQNRLMAEKIFTRPTVIINVASVARYVSVTGGVRVPQRLPWTPDLTLTSAIGSSGGLGDFGNPKGIRIVRSGQVFATYNYNDVLKNLSTDPKLLPGDQVLVRE